MRVRAIDGGGDWLLGKGANDYAQGNNAVAFLIAYRLRSFLGDCFFDLSAGIDWFNLLGSKNETQLQLAISSVILNTENVTSIKQLLFDLNRSNRALTIHYSVSTTFGISSGTVDFNPNAA